jgi:predicted Zn-dependent protease
MSNDKLPLDRDAMRLVADIGFMGAQTGQLAASRALFDALRTLRPDSTLPFIGIAVAELTSDRAEHAVRILRDEGLKQHPDDPELLAFLGMALQSAGNNIEARKVLSDLMRRPGADNAPHLAMAAKLLATGDKAAATGPANLMPRWTEPAPQATSN